MKSIKVYVTVNMYVSNYVIVFEYLWRAFSEASNRKQTCQFRCKSNHEGNLNTFSRSVQMSFIERKFLSPMRIFDREETHVGGPTPGGNLYRN